MAPKKPSGFMIFTLEWKQKNGQHMNMAKATSAAGEIWKTMGPEQREPYMKRAQSAKSSNDTSNTNILTCVGTTLDHVENERLEKQKTEQNMIESIGKTLKLAVDGGRLEREKFHFISINYFTRLLSSNVYVPAEIAIVEFSLSQGIIRKYHTFVNPKFEFYGNLYEVQNHADKTHGLPLPPNAKGEDNLSQILTEIHSFIWNSDSDSYCPVFTHNNAINYTNSALNFLSDHHESEIPDLKVFSIQELFYALKCAVCEIASLEKPRNRFVSDSILERDAFDYTSNIACDFHEEIDRSIYCALSRICRWSFSFADYMAMDLSITFIPGHHMPGTYNADTVINSVNSYFDNKITDSICGAMSTLSMESKYLSCDDYDNSSSSHMKSSNQVMSSSRASKRAKMNEMLMELYAESEQDYYSYGCDDDFNPPDSRVFAIDYCGDETETSVASSYLTRGRGRGIAIFDDFEIKK